MRIWKHWVKETARVTGPRGKVLELGAWGGSATSLDDARRRAREVLASIVRRVEAGQDLERYAYSDRPLREEIVEEIDGAVITRNSHGALVLNTREAMFIDVDVEAEPRAGIGRTVAGLFGRKREPTEHAGLAGVRQAAARWPEMGLRVYRTCKGLRCLVTSATFDPQSSEAQAVLTAFGSDPLYVRLCLAQESFRARLTPKHWRIGVPRPPVRYPWSDAAEQQRHLEWVRAYQERATGYSTCELLATLGPPRIAPEVEPIVTLHDRHVFTPAGGRLA